MDARIGYGIGAGVLLIGSIFMYFKAGTHEEEPNEVDEPLDEPSGEPNQTGGGRTENKLQTIYRKYAPEPKDVLAKLKPTDVFGLKRIVFSKTNIVFQEPWKGDLRNITDYFIFSIRMGCARIGKDVPPIDIYDPKQVLTEKEEKQLLRNLKWNEGCTLLPVNRIIHLLNELVGDRKDIKYIDSSAGWGDRMTASLLYGVSEYIAYDPNTDLKKGHAEIKEYFSGDLFGSLNKKHPTERGDYKVIYKPFEDEYRGETKYTNYFDICISSPPFFITEIYSTDPSQSTSKYKTLDDWLYKFLLPSFKKVLRMLKPDGFLCWYIEDLPNYRYVSTFLKEVEKIRKCQLTKKIGYRYTDQPNARYFYVWQKTEVLNTFYIKTDDPENTLAKRKQIEAFGFTFSDTFPVRFIFLQGEAVYYRNRFDTKGSEWLSLLDGPSKAILTNKVRLHKTFHDAPFLLKSKVLTKSNLIIGELPSEFLKIVKPLNGFKGEGIKVVKTKEELISHIANNPNPKYEEWILQEYIDTPALKDGRKFHFRILVMVVVSKDAFHVHLFNKFLFIRAKKVYKKGDYDDKEIHDTHQHELPILFPTELADGWTKEDGHMISGKIQSAVRTIFQKQHDFKATWGAKNGFEVFGMDVLFDEKTPYILEINDRVTGDYTTPNLPFLMEGILAILFTNRESDHTTKLI